MQRRDPRDHRVELEHAIYFKVDSAQCDKESVAVVLKKHAPSIIIEKLMVQEDHHSTL